MHAKLISLNGTCRRVVLLMLLPVMARQGDAPCARPCGRENTCADFNRSFTCDRLSSGLGCNCTGCCLAILMPSPRLAPPAALNTTPLIRAAQTSANNNQTAVHVSSVAALAVQECALVRSQKSFSLNNRQTRTGCAPGRRLEGQTANGRLELADINGLLAKRQAQAPRAYSSNAAHGGYVHVHASHVSKHFDVNRSANYYREKLALCRLMRCASECANRSSYFPQLLHFDDQTLTLSMTSEGRPLATDARDNAKTLRLINTSLTRDDVKTQLRCIREQLTQARVVHFDMMCKQVLMKSRLATTPAAAAAATTVGEAAGGSSGGSSSWPKSSPAPTHEHQHHDDDDHNDHYHDDHHNRMHVFSFLTLADFDSATVDGIGREEIGAAGSPALAGAVWNTSSGWGRNSQNPLVWKRLEGCLP